MFSVLFRRGSFATQKVLRWAAAPQRCWTSALIGAADGRTVPSSTRLSPTDAGQPGDVLSSTRTALLRNTQTFSLLARNQHFHSSAVRLKKRAVPEPPPRELDLLRYDMKHLWKGPKPALYLGFAGLLPFVCPTLFMVVSEGFYPDLAYAQFAYGASIVSFLGGARWGFALPESSPAKPDWVNLANSVVPALLAWLSMLLSENLTVAGTLVIMALGVSLHYDLSLLPTYPSWFKALRAVLTVVAFFSLMGTIFLNGLYPDKKLLGD